MHNLDVVKIEGHTALVRDKRTSCILNASQSEFEEFLKRRNDRRRDKTRIEELEACVAQLRDQLNILVNAILPIKDLK